MGALIVLSLVIIIGEVMAYKIGYQKGKNETRELYYSENEGWRGK